MRLLAGLQDAMLWREVQRAGYRLEVSFLGRILALPALRDEVAVLLAALGMDPDLWRSA